MSQGKYQVRRKIYTNKFEVYCITDNEVVCHFATETQAQKYADKLNGKEGE